MEESDDDSEVEDSDDFTSGSCEEDRRESKTQVINFKHSQAEERLQPQEVCVLHSIMHVCTFTCNTLMSYLEIFWIVLL